MAKSKVAKNSAIEVEVIKLGDKIYKIKANSGDTVKQCIEKAGVTIDDKYEIRVLKVGTLFNKTKVTEKKVKLADKVKESLKIIYIPRVRGGIR